MARPPSSTVFIGNITYDVTEQGLMDIFSEVGSVKSLRLVTDKDTGKPKGYGFCEFFDTNTAESAVRNLNGHEVSGRALRVDFAEEHSAGGGGGERSGGDRDRKPRSAVVDKDPGARPPPGTKPLGIQAASAALQTMSGLLGGPFGPLPAQEHMNATLANMTPLQLLEVMASMKTLVQEDQGTARDILVQNPQLTRAMFQAQIALGMLKTPPPGSSQPSHHSQGPAQLRQQGGLGPGPQGPPMGMNQPMGGMGGPPGQGYDGPGMNMQQPGPFLTPPPDPGFQQQQQQPPQLHMQLPQQPQGMMGLGGGMPPMMDGAPGPQGPQLQAPPQQHPQPGFILAGHSPIQQPQQPAQPPAAPSNPAGLSNDQQQQLLVQILSLTPEQLAALPPTEKAQAEAIILMMKGQR